MSTIQVELSESMRQFVEQEAAKAGFGAPGDYIQSVLRDLQTRHGKRDLEAASLEGIDSPARELRPEEWSEMRHEALERVAAKTVP
jgi:antitoxin ParD1/3/4